MRLDNFHDVYTEICYFDLNNKKYILLQKKSLRKLLKLFEINNNNNENQLVLKKNILYQQSRFSMKHLKIKNKKFNLNTGGDKRSIKGSRNWSGVVKISDIIEGLI